MTGLTKPAARSVLELQTRLNLAGVRYFTALELLRIGKRPTGEALGYDGSHFAAPSPVQVELVRIAIVMDGIRAELGAAIIIKSGYRPRDYNQAVGGAKVSQHIQGRAVDATSVDLDGLRRLTLAAFERGDLRGFGSYRDRVHADVRPGKPASWGSML